MCEKDENNIPKILYKYMKITKFKKYHESYLKGNLFFADRKSLNDPMENASLIDRFILEVGSDNEYKEYTEYMEDWESVLKINPNCIAAKINIERVRKMRGY